MKKQQTQSYWRLVAAAGVVSAFVASACVVTTTDDDSTGGSTNVAGSSAAGAAAGGSPAAAGSGAGGAAAGSGGTGGSVDTSKVPACDKASGPIGSGGDCLATGTDDCGKCLKDKCCAEYSECQGTSPGNVCGFGGPNNLGEFNFYRACLQKAFKDNGSISNSDRETCANNSVTSTDAAGALDCGTLGDATNALIGCVMEFSCNEACYGG